MILLGIAGAVICTVVVYIIIMSDRLKNLQNMTAEEMIIYDTDGKEEAVITVGILKDGEMSYHVYGCDGMPAEEYEYEIGSLTKTFTSSLLCKAIEEGKLSLEAPITEYYPYEPKEAATTLRKLATHTSGYSSHYFTKGFIRNFFRGEKNDFCGIKEENLIYGLEKETIKEKNYEFQYSNFGMAVVGQIAADAYGGEYRQVMDDYIRKDLGLQHTYISDGTGNMQNYWNWEKEDAYLPAGAVISTISDMMRYVEIHMKTEIPYLALAHERHAESHASSKINEQMGVRIDAQGLGWMLDDELGVIWHNGGTSHFNSYAGFDKERQIGVVVLSNCAPGYRVPATVIGPRLIRELQEESK